MLQKLNSAASSPAGPHYGSAALQLRTTVAAGKSFRLLRCLSCEKMSRVEELTSVFDDRAGVMDGDPRRRSHLLAVHGIGAASFQSPADLRHRDGRKPCRRTKTPSRIATGSLASSLGHSQPNARICSRRRTHAAGEAGLPHLPEGDLLLAWHAPNLPKNHPQPECGIWHRLTECQGRRCRPEVSCGGTLEGLSSAGPCRRALLQRQVNGSRPVFGSEATAPSVAVQYRRASRYLRNGSQKTA
jgi:hypothetical protein